MYTTLLALHSWLRWLVLFSLLLSIYRSYIGLYKKKPFSWVDNRIRHNTATIAHMQLILGIIIFFKSPIIPIFWASPARYINHSEISFFGLIHPLLMFGSIVLLTVGSAMTKRKNTDQQKFKTMLIWYSVVLIIMLIAVPWPFSPLANRMYFRTF